MTLQEVIERLREEQPALAKLGVKHVWVFGSLARGEARQTSDIDLAVEVDRTRRMGVRGLMKIQDKLGAVLGSHVDVVGLPVTFKPALKQAIERDRVAAF